MKYLYSILIIAIGFFAIPFLFDVSGNAVDHIRLMGKDGDDRAPVRYESRERFNDAVVTQTLPQPREVRVVKE